MVVTATDPPPIDLPALDLPPIVTAAWLAEHLDDPDLVVADVRYYLDGRSGSAAFEEEHLPGAVWIELERWLAAPGGPGLGRHPLPDPATFAEGMGRAGIGDGTTVVAYDDLGGMVAGRLVWMLRSTGHPAALLDGGLTAWPGPRSTGPVELPEPASFTPRPWPAARLATIDDLRSVPPGTVVVDARAGERYRGEVEPIDARAGHIPGAVNRPFAGNLDDAGRFLSAERLADRFADLAGSDVVVYCGSGVSACHDILAMEAAGIPARLFVGSWSAWSSQPELPVATGEERR